MYLLNNQKSFKTKLNDIDPSDLKLYSSVQEEIREIEANQRIIKSY